MMAHDVFICYASQDQAVAEEVCSKLEGTGGPVLDPHREMYRPANGVEQSWRRWLKAASWS